MRRIDADNWAAISPYLDQALDLSEDELARWLVAVEKENPALARDLQSLIDDHRAADRSKFLEGTAPPHPLPAAGTKVGAYTLVAPIGHGGMGTVWLARRSDGRFDGPAAVKLLNVALAGSEGEARFRREGQILARVTHPHIAHLIDAGVLPAGQLYLVLEYVEGQPIDAYCAGRALEAAARIDLFLQVLDAVAHAHANLVIHRDLKPSNVLVRDDGHVKLLDFGIATLVESEGEMATRLTREGGRAMTPAFAAPEQIAGERITTATDVYALGVLLYVLLTGRHPAGDAVQSPLALVKAIAESEPPRVSDAAGTAAARRALRGDLDTILAKALKKSPQERYGSVSAMADDLMRSRRHEPIAARARQLTLPRGEVRAPPPGVRYRDGGDSRHAFCRAVCDEPAARDRRAPVRAGPPARQQAVRYRRPGPGIARQRQSATADCRHVTRVPAPGRSRRARRCRSRARDRHRVHAGRAGAGRANLRQSRPARSGGRDAAHGVALHRCGPCRETARPHSHASRRANRTRPHDSPRAQGWRRRGGESGARVGAPARPVPRLRADRSPREGAGRHHDDERGEPVPAVR